MPDAGFHVSIKEMGNACIIHTSLSNFQTTFSHLCPESRIPLRGESYLLQRPATVLDLLRQKFKLTLQTIDHLLETEQEIFSELLEQAILILCQENLPVFTSIISQP